MHTDAQGPQRRARLPCRAMQPSAWHAFLACMHAGRLSRFCPCNSAPWRAATGCPSGGSPIQPQSASPDQAPTLPRSPRDQAFLTSTHLCIAMELVEGGSLFHYVLGRGAHDHPPLSVADARWWVRVGWGQAGRPGGAAGHARLEGMCLLE